MKKYLIAGLITLLPLALTIIIVAFLFDFFASLLLPISSVVIEQIPLYLPPTLSLFISRVLALILLCILTLMLGFIARQFFFKGILHAANKVLFRIPFVKTVYKVTRDVFSAILSTEEGKGIKESVLTPFPHAPHFGVGFSTGEAAKECQEKTGMRLISVFAPTAPHPISGFLFLVPEKNLQSSGMTKEEAFKYLVSCGVILPDGHEKQ
ncbi:MAG: DUF502 domain-containing protein [Verrucomicrobiota bacterium]|nr:DUF502 domain-containing protein [Verrucomicrobiota bacterium]